MKKLHPIKLLSLLGVFSLMSACGESGSISPVSPSITCSHSLEKNPMVNEVEQHISVISMVVSETFINEKVDLSNLSAGAQSLPGIAKLKTKDDVEVVRTGNYIFTIAEDKSIFSFNQFVPLNGLGGIPVNKEEFIKTFGAYPSISCELL